MIMSEVESKFMKRALVLAEFGPISDNPRVGAVVVRNGEIVGEGFHRGAGTPHAEVEAIESAGDRARGGTIYVTLEPCSHYGRTGPCTEAILDAGLATVIYAQSDPTEQARGGGEVLADAGVHVIGGYHLEESERLNRAWNHWRVTGKPFVTWKFAQSLDARVAERSGVRTRISGQNSQEATHILRSQVDAIVVGTRTANIDNPMLTARNNKGALHPRQPIRVVVGMSELRADSLLMNSPGGEVIHMRTHDPKLVVDQLAARGVRHILVEGGPKLAGAFLEAGVINQIITVLAPVTFSAGPPALQVMLKEPYSVSRIHWQRLGPDLVINGILEPR